VSRHALSSAGGAPEFSPVRKYWAQSTKDVEHRRCDTLHIRHAALHPALPCLVIPIVQAAQRELVSATACKLAASTPGSFGDVYQNKRDAGADLCESKGVRGFLEQGKTAARSDAAQKEPTLHTNMTIRNCKILTSIESVQHSNAPAVAVV
jgi:hypothetical protein